MPCIHMVISGKVQGVFYRASAKKMAVEIGITGWIRNVSDGSVECVACANTEQLKKFEDWCKAGPPDAKVKEVIISPADEEDFKSFVIR